jgi:GNAT superfamily N-acetyltransferase
MQMHGTRPTLSTAPNSRAISIRIARDPNDLMLVTAIRSAVYLAEQDCPIEEEFDGNDLVAAHFIGFVGKEPAGCLRVRFFGEFAKVERLAVRHQFRRSRVSFKLVQASVEYIRRKGFRKICMRIRLRIRWSSRGRHRRLGRGRWLRRKRLRCWARTGADFSTPIARIRTRIRRRFRIFCRSFRSLLFRPG